MRKPHADKEVLLFVFFCFFFLFFQPNNKVTFLKLHKNIYCGYSLEMPH